MSCKSPSRQIIHETDAARRHRLVILKGGVPTQSEWFEAREVGHFNGLFFHVGAAGGMPAVFRVAAVEHETLG